MNLSERIYLKIDFNLNDSKNKPRHQSWTFLIDSVSVLYPAHMIATISLLIIFLGVIKQPELFISTMKHVVGAGLALDKMDMGLVPYINLKTG